MEKILDAYSIDDIFKQRYYRPALETAIEKFHRLEGDIDAQGKFLEERQRLLREVGQASSMSLSGISAAEVAFVFIAFCRIEELAAKERSE